MNREQYTLPSGRNEEIFHESIAPSLYSEVSKVDQPRALFFRGQPGSGKSVARDRAVSALHSEDGPHSAVVVDIDAFRRFHPLYESLQESDQSTAAFFTDLDCGAWTEHAISYAVNTGSHVVLEGTLRNEKPTLETARDLTEKGVNPELYLLGVHELVSRSRIFERYVNQSRDGSSGRYTLPEAHDAVYQVLPETVGRTVASGLFSDIHIVDSKGQSTIAIDGYSRDADRRSVLALLNAQQLSTASLSDIQALIQKLRPTIERQNNENILHDFYRLERDIQLRTLGRFAVSTVDSEYV